MVRMFVNKVGFDSEGRAVVILLDEEQKRFLPIVIGQFEAHAIAFADQRPMQRPLTHDLLISVIEELDYRVERMEIVKLEDHIFYGLLHIENEEGDHHAIDARPSDCLAIVVRAEVPIYVNEDVLERARWLSDEAESEEQEKFRELMEDVTFDKNQTEDEEQNDETDQEDV